MNLVTSPFKLSAVAFVVTSVVVVAGTFKDLDFHSNAFMSSPEPVQIDQRLDDSHIRHVASSKKLRIPIIYFPLNKENRERISGEWEITRFVDQFENEELPSLSVNFELTDTSIVRINDEIEQEFGITFLSDKNTIGLVKAIGDGIEIIEARKVVKLEPDKEEIKKEAVVKKKEEEKVKGLLYSDVEYLSLKSVLYPKKSKQILKGQSVDGTLKMTGEAIEEFSITVYLPNDEEVRMDIPFAKIKDAGSFMDDGVDGPISGIITNNGKKGHYRVRFVTGPLAGAFLSFIPQDEYEDSYEEVDTYSNEDPYEAEVRSQQANEMVDKRMRQQNKARNQRSVQNEEFDENLSYSSEEITPEEMAQKIKDSGFDFGQAHKSRDLASDL